MLGLGGAAADSHLDIAALQFELGDVFFDDELDEFFQLFLIHAIAGGSRSAGLTNGSEQLRRRAVLSGTVSESRNSDPRPRPYLRCVPHLCQTGKLPAQS